MDGKTFPHPVEAPGGAQSLLAWLRLIRSRRVGAATFFRLMTEHGSAEAALEALPDMAGAAGETGYAPCPAEAARRELDAGRAAGARLIAYGSAEYPAALAEIADPPPLLWARGDLSLLQRTMVALVGARNASSLGTRMARRLAEGLGKDGFACVSGLARGVDTAAHVASLDTGTVAVLAGGIDVIYPAENAALADRIATRGLLLSEQPVGLQPRARHFPRRNRIISGLAGAVVVIEAAARSGSLITAREALDQGREVLAVPGHPFDARAAGCNMLIRDGAGLVRGPEDVIEVLGTQAAAAQPRLPLPPQPPAEVPHRPEKRRAKVAEIPELHAEILARLGPSPLPEDQLIRDLAAPAQSVTPALIDLELAGKIKRQAGGLLSLVC